MTLTAEKAIKHIIKMENGVLYLKLKEEFDARKMQIHCTLARITKSGVHIVKADSEGEISSTSMTLTADELDLLEEGRQIVKRYWEREPLKHRDALLNCGHIVNWDEWNEQENSFADAPSDTYQTPDEIARAWCSECESMEGIYRFDPKHFI